MTSPSMYKTLLLLILIFFQNEISGQDTFEKTFGGSNSEQAWFVMEQADSSFIMAGGSRSYGNQCEFYLAKTDALGNMLWYNTYGQAQDNYCWAFTRCMDGGFLLGGSTSTSGIYLDNYLVKVDSAGNQLWDKTFGGSFNDKILSVIQAHDSSYFAVGYENNVGQVIKLDKQGDTVWQNALLNYSSSRYNNIIQTNDSNLIIAGYANDTTAISTILMTKLDYSGNILWEKNYGWSSYQVAQCVLQTSGQGFILSGYHSNPLSSNDRLFVLKTNSQGDSLWVKTFSGLHLTNANSIEQTTDGGYIITGNRKSPGFMPDMYLLKLDKYGNKQWIRFFGGSDMDYGLSVKQTFDGGYIVSGTNSSMGAGGEDIYLVKTNGRGIVGVENYIAAPDITIYPNPTRGKFKIEGLIKAQAEVKVYDVTGSIVSGSKISSKNFQYDLSGNPEGMYLIEILTPDKKLVKKLIKF